MLSESSAQLFERLPSLDKTQLKALWQKSFGRPPSPIVWVPARSIVGMRLKPELQPAFKDGRLLILSPFPPSQDRITNALAQQRNRFVCALADHIFVPYAAPGSRTATLVEKIRILGKSILSLPDVMERVDGS